MAQPFLRTGGNHTAAERASLRKAAARAAAPAADPLGSLQWDMAMIGATVDAAHRRATGRGTEVGIIDTGVDGTHPDLAPNFDRARSRNFTQDIPTIDGPCEVATCIDPPYVDDGGHGTHVAGTIGALDNTSGVVGVAPGARVWPIRVLNNSANALVRRLGIEPGRELPVQFGEKGVCGGRAHRRHFVA